MTKEEVVAAAEALVENVMGSWDGSHDPFHAYRVRNLALSLASEEGLHPDSLHVVSARLSHQHISFLLPPYCGSTVVSFVAAQ